MKKADSDDMRPEYDFSSGVRGKYLPRLAKGTNVVVLDRDVAKVDGLLQSTNRIGIFAAFVEHPAPGIDKCRISRIRESVRPERARSRLDLSVR